MSFCKSSSRNPSLIWSNQVLQNCKINSTKKNRQINQLKKKRENYLRLESELPKHSPL